MCSDSYPIPILSLFFLYYPYIPYFLIQRIFYFLVYIHRTEHILRRLCIRSQIHYQDMPQLSQIHLQKWKSLQKHYTVFKPAEKMCIKRWDICSSHSVHCMYLHTVDLKRKSQFLDAGEVDLYFSLYWDGLVVTMDQGWLAGPSDLRQCLAGLILGWGILCQ